MKERVSDLAFDEETSPRMRFWLRKQAEEEEKIASNPCRHERCKRPELHAFHHLDEDEDDIAAHEKALGWKDDPLEPEDWSMRTLVLGNKQIPDDLVKKEIDVAPWERIAPNALDEAIISASAVHKAKIFAELYRDVKLTYGEVTERTVYRRLDLLVQQNKITYVKFIEREPKQGKGRKTSNEVREHYVSALRTKKVNQLYKEWFGTGLKVSCIMKDDVDYDNPNLRKIAALHPLSALALMIAAELEVQAEIEEREQRLMLKRRPGLAGYVKAGSKLLRDPEAIHEQLYDANCGNAL